MQITKVQKTIGAVVIVVILISGGVFLMLRITSKNKVVPLNTANGSQENKNINQEATTPVPAAKDYNAVVKDLEGKAKTAEEYFNLGVGYYNLGKLDKAIASYNSAISIDPNNARVYGNLGNAYRDMSEFTKAEQSYQKAIALDSQNSKFYIGLAFLYNGFMNNKSAAITTLNKGLTAIPDNQEMKDLLAEYQK